MVYNSLFRISAKNCDKYDDRLQCRVVKTSTAPTPFNVNALKQCGISRQSKLRVQISH